ncbi:GH32 C-terminal domain-containing protein [Emticicia sp. SJ17W-69]|uniref:GH32 C-terminal domain-containing protein n=1 Tax=Emticicia sp. SJ17W-69 TaxID=3421657 RepID=UPI003EBDC8B1
MRNKIFICGLLLSQLAYSQSIVDIKERMRIRLASQDKWHTVIMMEDLSLEGDNGMTWRNNTESYMIEIEFDPNGASEFGVRVLLKENLNQEAIVGYQLNNEQLYINSIHAGRNDAVNILGMWVIPMKTDRGRVKMQIFVDKTSVEVFGNDGEARLISRVFPEENSTDWQVFSNGRAKVTKLVVWEQSN